MNPYNTPLVNELTCHYCNFVGQTLRGRMRHEASCPSKRLAKKPTTPSLPAPATLGSTPIADPAGKKINQVLQELVERVRSTKIEHVEITRNGSKWRVEAEWDEGSMT